MSNLVEIRFRRNFLSVLHLNLVLSPIIIKGYQDISVLSICDISVLGNGHLGTLYWKFRY